MNKFKSIWASITGSVSSVIPLLFACCKSGACVGVCASPITSLFGISTAGMVSSPWFGFLEPVLIAVSAVSFTISYYNIYVLPKYTTSCDTSCDCAPSIDKQKQELYSKIIFWVGLIASLVFFIYFEVQKHQVATQKAATEIVEEACCAEGESCEK